jgi:hypothetical protein
MTGYNSSFEGCTPFTDTNSNFNLAANIGLSYTVPGPSSLRYRAKFSYASNSNVWVSNNGTAATPVAGTQNSTSIQEFKPDIKYVKGGDVLSLISSDVAGAQVGVALLLVG